MAEIYSVHNWDVHYENSESRKVKTCRYVCTPNKHDGRGYGRMMAHPESERLFAAWNAIIQVASKMPSRGILKDQDGPLTPQDMAFKTRLKAETFQIAFSFFSDQSMGWMDKSSEISQSPEISGDAGKNPLGREGKGMEGKPPIPPKSKEAENFQTFAEPIKRIFSFNPTSVSDERKLWDWCQDFAAKGTTAEEVETMAKRAAVLWDGKPFTAKGILNNWDSLKNAKPPKQKTMQGALN